MQKSAKTFSFGSTSNNLGLDSDFDGTTEAHTSGEKEVEKTKNQNNCQFLNYSDHPLSAAHFDLIVLTSKYPLPV